jgi:hypothetical protein
VSPCSIRFASSNLLRGVQKRAPARFAQEELERIGAHLVGAPAGGLQRLLVELQPFDQLDPAPLQLAQQRLRLHRIELECFHDRIQLCRVHCATCLRALEQALHLLELKDRLDLDHHGTRRFLGAAPSARGSGSHCESSGRGLRDKEERGRSARFGAGVKDRLLAACDRHYSAPRTRTRTAEDLSGM